MNQTNKKIFDDFPKVDCNECEHYYTNACDGVSKGSERPCKTFLATRSVNIPAKIKSLEKAVKWLTEVYMILVITIVVCIIAHLLLM